MEGSDFQAEFFRFQQMVIEFQERQERRAQNTMHGLTFKLRASTVRRLLAAGRKATEEALVERREQLKVVQAELVALEDERDRPSPQAAEMVSQIERTCTHLQHKIDTIALLESTVENDALVYECQYEHAHFLVALADNQDPQSHPTGYLSRFLA